VVDEKPEIVDKYNVDEQEKPVSPFFSEAEDQVNLTVPIGQTLDP